MGQRVIPVAVTAEYVAGDGVTLGAAGSHNSVLIEYDFRAAGPQWENTSKYVLWTNPQGNSTNRINLGVAEKVEGYEGVYQAAPPADAMCVPGWAEMVVVGYTLNGETEVTKVKTEPSRFRVLPGSSRAADNEGVAPTVADQLQAEIEAVDDRKVNKPVNPYDKNGTAGQILESLGDGNTRWRNEKIASPEVVNEVLEQHPDWVTTVQNGSISEEKLASSLKPQVMNAYVTPEMFGATGDGQTDDTAAFETMVAQGNKIYVPDNSYNLQHPVFADQESVVANRGTYPGAGFVVNSLISRASPATRYYKRKTFAELNVDSTNYNGFQSAAYDSTRDRVVLGFNASAEDNNNVVLVAVDSTFTNVLISSTILGYHANDMTYNPNTDRIYIATLVTSDPILVVNPATLEVESTINIGYFISCISYDADNDIYYVKGTNRMDIYDNAFQLLKSNALASNEISAIYSTSGTGGLRGQASIVLDSNFIQVYNVLGYNKCMETLLVQRSSKDGSVKQVYGFVPYDTYDENETVIKINSDLFVLGLKPRESTAADRIITVDKLMFSGALSLQQQPLLLNDGNLQYSSKFLSVVSNRCEITSGGYVQIGNLVLVHLNIKLLITRDGPSFFQVVSGFPQPASSCALSIVGLADDQGTAARGNPCAAEMEATSPGVIYIKHNTAVTANETYAIDGVYLRRIYPLNGT